MPSEKQRKRCAHEHQEGRDCRKKETHDRAFAQADQDCAGQASSQGRKRKAP